MSTSKPSAARSAFARIAPFVPMALVLACARPDESPQLALRVSFVCDADRLASDRLRLVIHEADCDGDTLYEELLSRGEQPGVMPNLPGGRYGFEAVALTSGATVASTCEVHALPVSEGRVALELSSRDCGATAVDAGAAPVFRGGDAGSVSADDAGSAAPALPGDGGITPGAPDGSVEPPITGECGAGGGACEGCGRTCPGGTRCEGGACKPDAASGCSAVRYGDHDYLFCGEALTWNTARGRCRDWGFGLVRIDDAAENAFVQGRLAGRDAWLGASDLGASDIGVTGVDVQLQGSGFGSDTPSCRKVAASVGEGNWYWASERSDVSNDTALCTFDEASGACTPSAGRYVNFNPGEPDNAHCTCLAVCLPGEDCAVMLAGSGAWSDRGCLQFASFVCEASF
jgi:hypothetical protein